MFRHIFHILGQLAKVFKLKVKRLADAMSLELKTLSSRDTCPQRVPCHYILDNCLPCPLCVASGGGGPYWTRFGYASNAYRVERIHISDKRGMLSRTIVEVLAWPRGKSNTNKARRKPNPFLNPHITSCESSIAGLFANCVGSHMCGPNAGHGLA